MTLYGRPLILFFNGDNLTSNGSVPLDNRFEVRITGSQPYVQWGYDMPEKQSLYIDGYTYVIPRYDAYGNQRDVTYSEGLYDQQWHYAIDLAWQGKVKYVAIISWNEYGERTQIEPCKDATSDQPQNYFLMYNKTKAYIEMIKNITTPSPLRTEIIYATTGALVFTVMVLTALILRKKKRGQKNQN